MVKVLKIEMFANKTSLNFGHNAPKVRPINTNKYWKLITAFAIVHFFTNMLRYADAVPVSNEFRFRRHFPVETFKPDKISDLDSSPPKTEKGKSNLF